MGDKQGVMRALDTEAVYSRISGTLINMVCLCTAYVVSATEDNVGLTDSCIDALW